MATTSNAKTVKKHSTQNQNKILNTVPSVAKPIKKKKQKLGMQKPLNAVYAAIYLTKGDKKMRADHICNYQDRKHYILAENEVWHKVQIIDLGEITK